MTKSKKLVESVEGAKNTGGRPTVFEQSMIDRANEYIEFFWLSEEARQELETNMANSTEVVPSVSGLALYLGVARSTVQKWESDKEHEFSGTLERLKTVQEVLLLNNGLQGKFHAQITKLMLANHGYSDKQDINMTIDPLSALIDEIGNVARGGENVS